ncbi:MAG: hypothetical protein AAB909_00165 [Patescibacteria group bacterium]
MKTSVQDPREVLEYLRPYYRAQKVIVIVEFFDQTVATGELQGIDHDSIQIASQDEATSVAVQIRDIMSITHSPVYEGKLKGVAA